MNDVARFSMKDKLIEERASWYGVLTISNLEAIARRLKTLLEGKRYTFVSVSDYYGPLPTPQVRTSQRLAPENSMHGEAIYIHYGDQRAWGMISVNDSYGSWSLSTNEDHPERAPYLVLKSTQFMVEHFAPSGNKLIWVIALEDAD